MTQYKPRVSASGMVIAFLILLNTIFLKSAYVDNDKYYWALLITVPLLVIAIWDRLRRKAT
jgi:hypothetical protein